MDVRTVGGATRLQPDFTRVNELAVRTERLPRRERDGVLPFPAAMWLWVGLAALLRLVVWLAAAALCVGAVAASTVEPGVPGALVVPVTAVALAAVLGHLARRLRRRSPAGWQAAVAGEYWSWRRPPGRFEHEPVLLDPPAWLRDPLHRRLLRWVRPAGQAVPHAERVTWARRWALSRELRAAPPRLAVVTALTAVLTVGAWRAGWLAAAAPAIVPGDVHLNGRVPNPDVLPALDVAVAAAADYAWQLADLVPLLNLTEVLGWERPAALAGGGLQDALALLFRLSVLLVAAVTIVRMPGRRVDVEAKPPLLAGQVERALVEELVKARRLLGDGGRHDARLFAAACRRLRADEVPVPPPYDEWNAESLAHTLALEQSWMNDWRVPEQRSVLS
ncbi:hypothetical protein [Catellatospora bangladeshensis]|uniref:Uncharacterized protein n=1 Tax=Catellatospora bangladeshensis TaxID=310355 RepID=A0A8J3JTR6_9ACTN|nr:hypothetical protein [Catellatospora bangladeshensis]GIF84858.1 hypothetical protein Cba03nite_62070 [Catellatospora bangladeshensis]